MPTVTRIEGFEIRVLLRNEHNPPHVHVFKAGGECRVLVGDEAIRPELWDIVGGMSDRDALRAEALVGLYQAECVAAWRKYHGSL